MMKGSDEEEDMIKSFKMCILNYFENGLQLLRGWLSVKRMGRNFKVKILWKQLILPTIITVFFVIVKIYQRSSTSVKKTSMLNILKSFPSKYEFDWYEIRTSVLWHGSEACYPLDHPLTWKSNQYMKLYGIAFQPTLTLTPEIKGNLYSLLNLCSSIVFCFNVFNVIRRKIQCYFPTSSCNHILLGICLLQWTNLTCIYRDHHVRTRDKNLQSLKINYATIMTPLSYHMPDIYQIPFTTTRHKTQLRSKRLQRVHWGPLTVVLQGTHSVTKSTPLWGSIGVDKYFKTLNRKKIVFK